MSSTGVILPMATQHVPAVSAIERSCFGAQWTATNFNKELDNQRCHYFVSLIEDKVVAYLGYWQILEEAHITAVGVIPKYRKQGLAQQLMIKMLNDCLDKSIRWITLEVKASNIGAQKLYEKFGFSVMGRRKNYYQAEREDALIMWTEDIAAADYQLRLEQIKASIESDFSKRSAS